MNVRNVSMDNLSIVEGYIYFYGTSFLHYCNFPSLRSIGAVDSGLYLESTGLEIFEAPVLNFIGGRLFLTSNSYLNTISLPELTKTEDIEIYYNNLTSIEFPMLFSINGSFFIEDEPSIMSISLLQLESCDGRFYINSLTMMTTLNVPMLNYVGDNFYILYNPALMAINFPMLNFVGKSLINFGVPQGEGALALISYPVLSYVEYVVGIENNYVLQLISMPSLATVGGPFTILNNNATKLVDFSSLRNVCAVYSGQIFLEQDIVYMLCPSLINDGLCSPFTITNYELPKIGCSNK